MRRIVSVLVMTLSLATLVEAMDTNAAGKCVALGTLSKDYEAKASIILATAAAEGRTEVVKQRAREEFVDLTRIRQDDMAKKGWISAAVRACDQF